MKISFNEVTWHDTSILRISLDRQMPGTSDEIEFAVENDTEGPMLVKFSQVWQMQCLLNFGIVSAETIKTAYMKDDHEDIDQLRQEWAKSGLDIGCVKLYEFETNSTASTIKIIAQDVQITPTRLR